MQYAAGFGKAFWFDQASSSFYIPFLFLKIRYWVFPHWCSCGRHTTGRKRSLFYYHNIGICRVRFRGTDEPVFEEHIHDQAVSSYPHHLSEYSHKALWAHTPAIFMNGLHRVADSKSIPALGVWFKKLLLHISPASDKVVPSSRLSSLRSALHFISCHEHVHESHQQTTYLSSKVSGPDSDLPRG